VQQANNTKHQNTNAKKQYIVNNKMKYLDVGNLTELSRELTDVVCGTRIINGRIEAYSCKRAGTDKKYAHSLAERYETEVSSDEVPFANSLYANGPLGDFHETSTRRLLTDLILTLNLSLPDYDFADVRPGHFRRLSSPKVAINRVNERLSDLALKKGAGFLNALWKAIDEVIGLSECKVYTFYPEGEGADPFISSSSRSRSESVGSAIDGDDLFEHELGATLWTFNYFIVNKQLKRIIFFTCLQNCLVDDTELSIEETTSVAQSKMMAQNENQEETGGSSFDEDDGDFDVVVDDVAQPSVSVQNA
jgi:hypothetical protein